MVRISLPPDWTSMETLLGYDNLTEDRGNVHLISNYSAHDGSMVKELWNIGFGFHLSFLVAEAVAFLDNYSLCKAGRIFGH